MVVMHRFIVACIFLSHLRSESLRLIFGIVQFAEAISQFTTPYKKLKPISDVWIVIVTTRQWRYFGRIFSDEGRLYQLVLSGLLEYLHLNAAKSPTGFNVDAEA